MSSKVLSARIRPPLPLAVAVAVVGVAVGGAVGGEGEEVVGGGCVAEVVEDVVAVTTGAGLGFFSFCFSFLGAGGGDTS